jgi:hypothetical protein
VKQKKRVLFIHIDFYEYNQRIKDKICQLGYELDSFCEDPPIGFFDKFIMRFKKELIQIKSIKNQKRFINDLKKSGMNYDYVFTIKGARLKKEFLSNLKIINPNTIFFLYMWDDVARVPNFFENRESYDKIFTFDRIDSKKYNINFLPLFYSDDFVFDSSSTKDIDLFFSGWMHSDRKNILELIIPILKSNKLNYFIHLYSSRYQVIRIIVKGKLFNKQQNYMSHKKISLENTAFLTTKSRIVLDIQHISQNGQTMRVFEALAAKCKIITTNQDIRFYDFYNENNILIIDRKNPVISNEFFKIPFVDVSNEIIERYSLGNWISAIINDEGN